MRINSFIVNPDDVNTHTNQYAEGTVSSQTFSERQKIERSRNVIGSYQYSQIGTNFITRDGAYTRQRIRVPGRSKAGARHNRRQEMNANGGTLSGTPERSAPTSRQEMNAQGGGMTFREPPSRGYNPYA